MFRRMMFAHEFFVGSRRPLDTLASLALLCIIVNYVLLSKHEGLLRVLNWIRHGHRVLASLD